VKVNYSFEEVAAPEDAKTVDGGNVQPKDATANTSILKGLANRVTGLI